LSEFRVVLAKITGEIFDVLLLISFQHIFIFSATCDEHTKPSSICVHYQQVEGAAHEAKAPNIHQDPPRIQKSVVWCVLCAVRIATGEFQQWGTWFTFETALFHI